MLGADLGLVKVHNVAEIDAAATNRSAVFDANVDNSVSLSIGEIGVYRPTLIQ